VEQLMQAYTQDLDLMEASSHQATLVADAVVEHCVGHVVPLLDTSAGLESDLTHSVECHADLQSEANNCTVSPLSGGKVSDSRVGGARVVGSGHELREPRPEIKKSFDADDDTESGSKFVVVAEVYAPHGEDSSVESEHGDNLNVSKRSYSVKRDNLLDAVGCKFVCADSDTNIVQMDGVDVASVYTTKDVKIIDGSKELRVDSEETRDDKLIGISSPNLSIVSKKLAYATEGCTKESKFANDSIQATNCGQIGQKSKVCYVEDNVRQRDATSPSVGSISEGIYDDEIDHVLKPTVTKVVSKMARTNESIRRRCLQVFIEPSDISDPYAFIGSQVPTKCKMKNKIVRKKIVHDAELIAKNQTSDNLSENDPAHVKRPALIESTDVDNPYDFIGSQATTGCEKKNDEIVCEEEEIVAEIGLFEEPVENTSRIKTRAIRGRNMSNNSIRNKRNASVAGKVSHLVTDGSSIQEELDVEKRNALIRKISDAEEYDLVFTQSQRLNTLKPGSRKTAPHSASLSKRKVSGCNNTLSTKPKRATFNPVDENFRVDQLETTNVDTEMIVGGEIYNLNGTEVSANGSPTSGKNFDPIINDPLINDPSVNSTVVEVCSNSHIVQTADLSLRDGLLPTCSKEMENRSVPNINPRVIVQVITTEDNTDQLVYTRRPESSYKAITFRNPVKRPSSVSCNAFVTKLVRKYGTPRSLHREWLSVSKVSRELNRGRKPLAFVRSENADRRRTKRVHTAKEFNALSIIVAKKSMYCLFCI